MRRRFAIMNELACFPKCRGAQTAIAFMMFTCRPDLELDNDSLFLFCGNRNDRFKGLYWDGEGFILLYKRFENGGLRWPRHREDAVALTKSQIKALLEGISPLPQKRIRPAIKGPGY